MGRGSCDLPNGQARRRISPYEPRLDQSLASKWLTRYPKVWAEQTGVGMAEKVPPIVVELKADGSPISVWQYPMSKDAKEGIWPHIKKLLLQGILIPCQSP